MTWEDVIAHLRERYLLGREEPGWVELWWSFRDGDAVVRQHQTVRSAEAFGEPYLLVAAEIAAGGTLSAPEALRHNASLAVGAIAVEEKDRFVLRHGLPRRDLSVAALDRVLRAVAHEAARLSLKLRATWNPVLYAQYCD